MERTRLQNLFIGLIVAAVGFFGMSQAMGMPAGTKPYTLVVTGIFTVLGLLLSANAVIYRNKPAHDCGVVTVKEMINPMIAFTMIAVYTLLIPRVGFFTTSAVFMLIFMVWMGYRKPVPMVLTTAGMLGFIWYLFVFSLNVPLPKGILM